MAETKKKTETKKKKVGPYDGRYDDIMEGEHLMSMRKAIEDFAAGKITKKKYLERENEFLDEFPKSAIALLKKDIAQDAKRKYFSK